MKPRFCENCGSARDAADKFCTKCGNRFRDGQDALAVGGTDDEAHDLPVDEQPVQDVLVEWDEELQIDEFQDEGYSNYSDRKSKIIGICVILALLAALGWYFGTQSGRSTTQSFVVTGTANVRSAPTTEGSEVLSVLAPGDHVTGEWVEGSTDATTRWLRLTGYDPARYVWSGNLEGPIDPVQIASEGSSDPNRAILGSWVCTSTIMGARELQNVTYEADGAFYGSSVISGVVDGRSMSGSTGYSGNWKIENGKLVENTRYYQFSDFRWMGPFLDRSITAEMRQEILENGPQNAAIEFESGRMLLTYDFDGLLAPVTCERASDAGECPYLDENECRAEAEANRNR